MAVSIVQKSTGRRKSNPRIALVLSGGAISGGAFKVGGMLALDHMMRNCRVTDFDIYVGISAGAFLAAPLAAGLTPQELMRSFASRSDKLLPFGARDFYRPNLSEIAGKGAKAIWDSMRFGPQALRSVFKVLSEQGPELKSALAELARRPDRRRLEALQRPFVQALLKASDLPHLFSYTPSGLLDNSRVERWVRLGFEKNRIPNSFPLLSLERGKSLYVEAVDLDTGDEVVFGPDEDSSVTISEAVQASTALPAFYRPVKLGSKWYVDGSVKHTAPMEVARLKGADLIVIYNPFRPYHQVPTRRLSPNFSSLAEMGLVVVLNQAIRGLIHSRLALGIEELKKDPAFQGDILVIEPAEDDAEFFNINPLAFWKRAEAARRGYRSAKLDFERNFLGLRTLMNRYGIDLSLSRLEEVDELLEQSDSDDETVVNILGREYPRRKPRLRAIS